MLFVSMSFILLLVISLAWLLFYYVQRFRYMHAKDRLAVSDLSFGAYAHVYLWHVASGASDRTTGTQHCQAIKE